MKDRKVEFFILRPIATTEKSAEGHTIYYTATGEPLQWSGESTLPAPGATVNVTMNGIGPAIVKGYFREHGYLGVMTLATNPPEWLRMQRGPNRDQLKAIHAWAKLHGRTWKAKLRQAWWTVNYHGFKDSHFLQQIRNQFGPEWLNNYDPNPEELAQPDWALEGIGCEFGCEIE